MTMSQGNDNWIYHERQEAALCGQHALNNLVQSCIFSPQSLGDIAHNLDQMELNFMAQGGRQSKEYLQRLAEGNQYVDASGNFSIEVLRAALLNHFNLSLPSIQQNDMSNKEVTEIEGFICNKQSHWFAIRKIHGRYWNLNSTKERPELITYYHVAAELSKLQKDGYSVFCVSGGLLPPPCTSAKERDARGSLPRYWWKEDDLISGKGSSAINGMTDPWKNVGSGMRLDGNRIKVHNDFEQQQSLQHLTEDEMLQRAISMSLQEVSNHSPTSSNTISTQSTLSSLQLKAEPTSAQEPSAIRIQFRLPTGKRAIRRFYDYEVVGVLFIYAREQLGNTNRKIELLSGYPPQNLELIKDVTLKDASLSGEMVQIRLA